MIIKDLTPYVQVLKEDKEVLTKKWTKPLIEAGYTAIPTIIIQRMRKQGSGLLLLHLMFMLFLMFWEIW